MKKPLLILFALLLGTIFYAQTTLVHYPFNNNTILGGRTYNPIYDGNPPAIPAYIPIISYSNPPAAFGYNRLEAKTNNDYVEIIINTTGFANVSLDFNSFLRYQGLGIGIWTVSYNAGNGWVDYGTSFLTGFSLFSVKEVTDSYSRVLPPVANNNPNLKIRITSTDITLGNGTLYIDDIKISAGNAIIGIYSAANDQIPHQSNASYLYDTDFGTMLTSTGSVSKTYTIKNTGSIPLTVSSISSTGQDAGDFTISNIPSTVPVSSSRTFNVVFDPSNDGIRTADINIYSNSAPNPYQFNVQGRGVSCALVPSTFKQNTFGVGTPSLTTIGIPAVVSGGSGNNYFPNNSNMYISNGVDDRSWFTNETSKTLEFGPINITGEKNVSISFYLGAFTSGNGSNGVNRGSSVILSVFNPLTNTWSDEMRVRGSDDNNTYFYYPFSPLGGQFEREYDGDNSFDTIDNLGSTNVLANKISFVKLKIPETFGNTLRFKISAVTTGSKRFWGIDEVKVNTENTVSKTYTVGNTWVPSPPNADEKAIIKGNLILPIGSYTVCECQVDDGGSLNLDSGANLTVQGKVVNNNNDVNNTASGKFVVSSDANLIQIEDGAQNTGNITVKRNVNDMNNISTKMDYVYWSSPVSGQQTKGAGGFSPGTPNNRFYTYRESNDRFYETGDPTFVPGKGYAVRAETGINPETSSAFTNPYAKDYKFKGVPNNGEISIDINRSADVGALQHGFNLVGNPYPSNIDFAKLYTANAALIYNNIYFWTNNSSTLTQEGSGYEGNNYAIYTGTGGNPATGVTSPTPTGIIKVGQGFIIQKRNLGGPAPLIFKNSYGAGQDLRVATAGTFYQKNSESKNRFWLQLTSPTGIVNTQLIGYIDGATDDFEQDFDAEAFGLSADLFYSVLNDKKLLIQGKAAQFSIDDQINLGANFFQPGSYTIALDNGEGIFNGSQIIYLKDKQEGIITNLSEGSYTFTAAKGDNSGRFEIIYKPESVLATDSNGKENIIVYRDGNNFVVKAQTKKITSLEVYDGAGRMTMSLNPNNVKAIIPTERLINGVYILKINQSGEITSKKIIR